jgi:arsenite-transporting ATPase
MPFSLAQLPHIDWFGWQTRFLFLTGKGGVGKTTVASTVAVRLAEMGRHVLIVSTDPASNLDDVFEMKVSSTLTPVPEVPHLSIMNLDPEAAAASYRERVVGPYRTFLPESAVRSMEEQLSGACTVEIAAFNEFTRLLADPSLVQQFDHIIFDTAPTGHTLRLLTLPSAWSGYIATSSHGANCLGPLAGLEAQREQYEGTVRALADAAQTTMVLVSRPEISALHEAGRSGEELRALGITNQHLVLNGVFSAPTQGDSIAGALVQRQDEALQGMTEILQGIPTTMVPLVASNLTGIAALQALAHATSQHPLEKDVFPMSVPPSQEVLSHHTIAHLVHRLEEDGHGVIMTMGKGGVGKTTIAAALAVALAHQGHQVHLSTTDPAAHLSYAVGSDIPAGLTVSRIDPAIETQRYAEEILAAASSLDAEGRALLEEDLRSPCTEEIAVFRAFARTIHAAKESFVVLDTAPTGHTLLLLDAAESYHREVARTTGHVPEEVRSLLPRLRDPAYTQVLLITLAESTPVQEAERLQADLRRAAIEPYGWVINASLSASGTQHPLLAQRAQLEQPHIHRVGQEHGSVWLIPWYAQALTGATALLALAGLERQKAAK